MMRIFVFCWISCGISAFCYGLYSLHQEKDLFLSDILLLGTFGLLGSSLLGPLTWILPMLVWLNDHGDKVVFPHARRKEKS